MRSDAVGDSPNAGKAEMVKVAIRAKVVKRILMGFREANARTGAGQITCADLITAIIAGMSHVQAVGIVNLAADPASSTKHVLELFRVAIVGPIQSIGARPAV